MTTIDEIDDLLARAGADLGRPDKRRARAVRLHGEGMTGADLAELVEWAHKAKRRVHTVGKWLQWATHTRERWQAHISDIRRVKAERTGAAAAVAAPVPQSQADRTAWLRGMAYARVVVDGPRAGESLQEHEQRVAAELAVSIEQLHDLVEQAKQARGPRGHRKLTVEEFREAMQQRKNGPVRVYRQQLAEAKETETW